MTQPRLVGGRYELGELIGYGGMAEVHRGRDTRLGRDVAIKVLRADLARDPSFLNRFRREAQSAAALNHPSIVAVYDTGQDVAPDGKVSRITGGWQVVSQRALDKKRSRYLDGRLIQPYHPFLKSTKKALKPGTIAPVDVEIFPTGAAIRPGHRLRIAVEGFDVPHLLAPLPDLLNQLGPVTIYSGAAHPSSVTLPVR